MGHKERPVKEGIPMGLLDLLLVAVGLSMDAFAVSVCKAGVYFGGFQALMPTLGYI